MPVTEDAMRISGKKIRERRRALGKTQAEIAATAGVNEKTIREYENGAGSFPQAQTVQGLAAALQLSMSTFRREYVIYDEGEGPQPAPDPVNVDGLDNESLDALLDRIMAEREARRLPPLPEHVEAAVLKRAAKPHPRQG